VKEGDVVSRGQQIGIAGRRGCASQAIDHLHFSVTRLTNLTGQRFLDFEGLPNGHGDNGYGARVDAYAWAALKGLDPWAFGYFGRFTDEYGISYVNPGAFDIQLWLPGEAPPSPNW
jgi:murein DD-endopeptidase MepM/ murein hydrolase activator NlpD